MKIIMVMNILFCASSHPVAMITFLIMITTLISYFLIYFLKNSWLSMIFILILLGGMLILFVYMASLTSNEAFKNKKVFILTPLVLFLPIFPMNSKNNFSEKNIFVLFNYYSSMNSLIMIFYLLLVLLIVMELISCSKNPLRSKL